MAYRWKPSATQRREFAQRMQDPNEQAAYLARKEQKAEKRRATSKFDYSSAGGLYVPTKAQYEWCMSNYSKELTEEQRNAFNQVTFGYSCQEKIHHDSIHIVNELIRNTECG